MQCRSGQGEGREQGEGGDFYSPHVSALEPLHGRKAVAFVSGGGRERKVRDLTPNDAPDVPTDYPTDPLGCGCAISPDAKELAFVKKDVPEEAVSTNADIFTLDLTNPDAKAVKVSTALGGDMNPAYSPDGKWLAWRSQARAGYEGDKFRLALYDRGT